MPLDSPLSTTGRLGGGRPSTTPTYVLEYLIRELADGVTPAPQFEVDGEIPSDGPFPDDEQIYTFTVDRLGLIDLSFSGALPPELADAPSGLGQRYVSWAWGRDFVLASATPLQKANDVEGEGFVNLESLETLPVASSQFYSRKGYVMPHGTVIRVRDLAPATPGVPFLLRFGVVIPASVRDDALMREALCCTENIPTVTDTDAPCLPPTFLTPPVSPNVLTPGVAPQQIQINASPVSSGFTSVVVAGPGGPVAPVAVDVQFPDKILFTGVFTVPGSYSVLLSNGAGCETLEGNAFTVGP